MIDAMTLTTTAELIALTKKNIFIETLPQTKILIKLS